MEHCPLHHVTYVPAKFEVAMAHGKGDALQENTLFEFDRKVKLPSTLAIM